MSADPRFAQAVEQTIATYDAVAENYAERNAQRPPFWNERMERFVDALHEVEQMSPLASIPVTDPDAELEEYLGTVPVLDAGCGPGRDARELAARGLPVLAVDLSQGMLDAAHERTARRLARGSIHYALMDMRHLSLPDACCRGVWSSASLLHLPKHVAPRAMAELARVARHGAPLMVFLKMAGNGPDQAYHAYEHEPAPDARRFFAFYTPGDATRLVEQAGFTVRDIAQTEDTRAPGAPGWIAILATRD